MARKKNRGPQKKSIASTRPPYNVAPTVPSTGQFQETQRGSPSDEQTSLTLDRLLQQYKANKHQSDADEQERDNRDRARLRVEKWALFFGFLGIVGLLYTLYVTREANTIARDAIKQTQEIAQATDRPWVGIHDIKLGEFVPGKKVRPTVKLRNSGKTPALDMEAQINGGFFRRIPEEPPNIPLVAPYISKIVMMPEQIVDVPSPSPHPIDQNAFNNVMKKDLILVVWGKITYTDRSPTKRETTMYAYYMPEEERFGACIRGNDAK